MDTNNSSVCKEKVLHVKLPIGTYRRLRHEAIERGLTNTQLIIAVFAEPEDANPDQPQANG